MLYRLQPVDSVSRVSREIAEICVEIAPLFRVRTIIPSN